MDTSSHITALVREITVLDAIMWINKSWNDIQCSTIQKCFAHCGFTPHSDTDGDDDPDDGIPLTDLNRHLTGVEVSSHDYITQDDNIPTEDTTDNWEREMVNQAKQKDNPDEAEAPEEDDEPADDEMPELNHQQVLEMLNRVRDFSLSTDTDYLESVQELIHMTD